MDTQSKSAPLERKTLFSIVLGLSYLQIGMISTLRGMAAQFLQALYGFVVPYVKRAVILGTGNFIVGLSVIATGFASSYSFVLGTRIFSGLGSSPQHPVGSTMLATHYPEARGRTLALHTTTGSIGSLLAPITAGLLLLHVDWRTIFWLVGGISFLTGVPYFLFRDAVRPATPRETLGGGKEGKAVQGWEAYKECLKNRNFLVISLVLMVGAAGRGGGVNTTFLVPHFVNDLKVDVTYAAFLFTLLQAAGLVAPLLWGWASDRVSRVGTIQFSLLVSCLSTVWLGWVSSMSVWLLISLAVYGLAVHSRQSLTQAAVHSRQSLTQALLSDIVEERSIDAAFSLYYAIGFLSGPFWTLFTGWMMQTYGFGYAFSVIAVSYLLGMVLLTLLRDPGSKKTHAGASV
jgi:FSR family fosmidomycin resistance protein-like MFS transporter